ncbi:MAG: response regulator, partial [Magnetococcales bacterium]|nr:response regulator [Magnetococcales bacterium]
GLNAKLQELNAIHGLFASSEQVDQNEFNNFVKKIMHGHANLNAIQWLPRQTCSPSRPFPDNPAAMSFRIPVSPDGQEMERYPIIYSQPSPDELYPMAEGEVVTQEIQRAMETARKDGQAKILVHKHDDDDPDQLHPYDMDILWPVYAYDAEKLPLPARTDMLRGFLRSRSELWFILEEFIQTLFVHPGGIDIFLFAEVNNKNEIIYHHFSRLRDRTPDIATIHAADLKHHFHLLKEVMMGDRTWQLILRPVDLTAYSSQQQWYPLAVWFASTLLTLLVTLYAHAFMKNAARIQTLAEEKSAALKESEERFRQLTTSEHRYRSVTESAWDGIVTTDENQRIVGWNQGAENIFQFQEAEILGQSLSMVIPTGTGQDLTRPEQSAIRSRAETTGLRKDRQEVPLELTSAQWSDGMRPYCTAIIRDVTTWKQMLDALKQAKETELKANQAKSIFLATMSHEIRTPMNGILGMAELLSLSPLNDEQREQVEVIQESGRNLIGIINNILDFSKIEANRIDLEEIEFDLTRLIHNQNVMFCEMARKKNLRLETVIAPRTPRRVRGDPHRVNQILVNLLGNAVKFTQAGHVRLTVDWGQEKEKNGLWMRIEDTGSGIDPDKIEELFEPFTQADSTMTRRFGGTGLGLSITRKLTERMGGTIQVSSRLGQGSTFTVFLPMAAEVESEASSVSAALLPAAESRKNSARILLVEDDRLNQRVLRGMFRQCGHEITVAEDGVEAMKLLKIQVFDVVFMDCHMPNMDGLTACRLFRERERQSGATTHPTPVIALTALATPEDRESCLRAGMSDFLSKPTSLHHLQGMLHRWLNPEERETDNDTH